MTVYHDSVAAAGKSYRRPFVGGHASPAWGDVLGFLAPTQAGGASTTITLVKGDLTLNGKVVSFSAQSGVFTVMPGHLTLTGYAGGVSFFTLPRSGYPPVPEFMPDDKEHRRQIARTLNSIRAGRINCYLDVTLTPSATSTAVTDARIGVFSVIIPMAQSANGAIAVAAGVWISEQGKGIATISHASSAAVDQNVRLLIIG